MSTAPQSVTVPPDAGSSYLGTYGLANPWSLWLLRKAPDLLALPPARLRTSDVGGRPPCPAPKESWSEERGCWRKWIDTGGPGQGFADLCERPMAYRPGAWCCYAHGETVRIPLPLKVEPGTLYDSDGKPVRDVLQFIGELVDVRFFGRPGEKPKWTAVKA